MLGVTVNLYIIIFGKGGSHPLNPLDSALLPPTCQELLEASQCTSEATQLHISEEHFLK
jgi:hypothetical protein